MNKKVRYCSVEITIWAITGSNAKLLSKEVDFLIKEGSKIKQLIQVTYASSKDEIEKREKHYLLLHLVLQE